MSLASIKRKQAQMEKEQRDAHIAMMLANTADQTPYRSSMNMHDQGKSIKQMRDAFKNKKNLLQQDKFSLLQEKPPSAR